MKRTKQTKHIARHRRVRAKIWGDASRPRLSVSRSVRYLRVQLIDDAKGVTIVSASDVKVQKGTKTERATAIGLEIAKKAKEKGVTAVVFDRGGFRFHGRIAAVAEGARQGGLIF
ncbi:MAG: 50S ribosomal protein L18 [Patescibacteria group bacterium]